LAYPFAISHLGNDGLPCVDPLPMWQALLADLAHAVPVPTIAARFHKGLAIVIADMLKTLGGQAHREQPLNTVALSGGVFQNRVLLEQVVTRLESAGFTVLKHRRLPANDGGLALGQAAIAAARALAQQSKQ
jgi:hydrogenase maturation protein HypF